MTHPATDPLDAIELQLIAEPVQLAMADRPAFRIGLVATNRGSATVDPELHRVRLWVNGQESVEWNEALGNGRRPPAWQALPPGDRVDATWSHLGPSLFPVPGDYTLVLEWQGRLLAAVHVSVRAA